MGFWKVLWYPIHIVIIFRRVMLQLKIILYAFLSALVFINFVIFKNLFFATVDAIKEIIYLKKRINQIKTLSSSSYTDNKE